MSERRLVAKVRWSHLQRQAGKGYRVNHQEHGTHRSDVYLNLPDSGGWTSWYDLTRTCNLPNSKCYILFDMEVGPLVEIQLRGERRKGGNMNPSNVWKGGDKINFPTVFDTGCRSEYRRNFGGWTTTGSNRRHDECPPIQRYSNNTFTIPENKVFIRARSRNCNRVWLNLSLGNGREQCNDFCSRRENNCGAQVRNHCNNTSRAFRSECNNLMTNWNGKYEEDVLHGYNTIAQAMAQGGHTSLRNQRGFDGGSNRRSGGDENILSLCQGARADSRLRQRCDQWYGLHCPQRPPGENHENMPECACLFELSYWFPGINFTSGAVQSPACYVQECHAGTGAASPAYQPSNALAQCNECVQNMVVVTPEDVNNLPGTLLENVNQTCVIVGGGDGTTEIPDTVVSPPIESPSLEPPPAEPEKLLIGLIVVAIGGFVFLLLLILIVKKKKASKKALQNKKMLALAMASSS